MGRLVDEEKSYQQAVEVFERIINQFGYGIYEEEKKLFGLVNDLFPGASIEKNILKSAIFLGAPSVVMDLFSDPENWREILDRAYQILKWGGLSDVWSAILLYILSRPSGIDSTDLYPIEIKRENLERSVNIAFYDKQAEEKYSLKTFDELLKLASTGDVIAETELGVRYHLGRNVKKDVNTAVRWFTKAADSGYPVAEFLMGKLYEKGLGLPFNPKAAREFIQRAAEKDYPMAQYAIGKMYYRGEWIEKNDAEALYWLRKAEEQLDDAALYLTLAMVYKESDEKSIQNEDKAFRFALRAAEMENADAYNFLGTLYEAGCGTAQSYRHALYYYIKAAENGAEIAYYNLAAFCLAGIVVPKDNKKAVKYFRYGAKTGNKYCLNALGMCYKNGIGVKQDYAKAFALFLESAYAGSFAGELNVAFAYERGQGVNTDKAEAKKWVNLAAEHRCCKEIAELGYTAKIIMNAGLSEADWREEIMGETKAIINVYSEDIDVSQLKSVFEDDDIYRVGDFYNENADRDCGSEWLTILLAVLPVADSVLSIVLAIKNELSEKLRVNLKKQGITRKTTYTIRVSLPFLFYEREEEIIIESEKDD